MANPDPTANVVALIERDQTTAVFLYDNLTADGWQVALVPPSSAIAATLQRVQPHVAIVDRGLITEATPNLKGVPMLVLGDTGRARFEDTDAPIAVCPVPFSYPALRQALKVLATAAPVNRPDGIPGDARRVELPFSEVCMHLRVAGQHRWVAPVGPNAAQIYDDDGRTFSIPITRSEAGLRDLPITAKENR